MNNYKRIKAMTIDEMSDFLRKFSNCSFCNYFLRPKSCSNCKQNYDRPFKQWLKEESEGNNAG